MPFRSNRWLPLAGIGALVVLNVVLIALLLTRPATPHASNQAELPPAGGSSTAAPTETPPLEKETPAELSGEQEVRLAPASRILVNADATSAWRATVGDCTSPGTLEHTTDQGQTWRELSVDLAPVSRIRVLGPETLFAIGGGTDCEPTYLSSSTAGRSWLSNEQFLEGSWYIEPANRSALATPAGVIEAPCEVVELAALDAQHGAVLCADATIAVTQDGGVSWSQADVEMVVSAIGVGADRYALAGTAELCGQSLAVGAMAVTGNGDGEFSCTQAEGSYSTDVAVSADAEAAWLWAGDDVFVSVDGSW